MVELESKIAELSVKDAPKQKKGSKNAGRAGAPPKEDPKFIEHRNRIFDELYKKQQEEIARKYSSIPMAAVKVSHN